MGLYHRASPDDNPRARVLHETPAVRIADLVADARDTLDLIPDIFIVLHDRIALGCRKAFFEFSAARIVVKSSGEKYLSTKR